MDHRSEVSIHAPAGGATSSVSKSLSRILTFQSTRPRGARLAMLPSAMTPLLCFNPRARGGRDEVVVAPNTDNSPWFNPRARGGRDISRHCVRRGITCFNPRARGGRDLTPKPTQQQQRKFQSTRPRGARRFFSCSFDPLKLSFQSTRPRGARRGDVRTAA